MRGCFNLLVFVLHRLALLLIAMGFCRGYLGNISDILRSVYHTDPEIWALLTNNGVFFSHSMD